MPRGPKKHLKRLNAPKHWMLDKLGGVFAPKPSAGPHKTRECLPLCLILRNRLKYALTYKEVTTILMQRLVKVDGKTRVDKCYPAGFMGEYREPPFPSHRSRREKETDPMADRKPHPPPSADVVSIDKTDEHFRLIYDAKGRFVVHRISSTEAQVSVPSHRGLRAGFYPKTGPSGTARVFHPLARRRSRLTILPPPPLPTTTVQAVQG